MAEAFMDVIAVCMAIAVFGGGAFILLQGHKHPAKKNRPSGGSSWWDKDPPMW